MKILYQKTKESVRRIALAGLAGLSLAGCNMGSEKLGFSINTFDATGDGIQDVVVFDEKTQEHFAFIGKGDGKLEKARVITQDGIPFYKTEKGIYTPWGDYVPNK